MPNQAGSAYFGRIQFLANLFKMFIKLNFLFYLDLQLCHKTLFSYVGESESFQKFEDDLKEYLEHEFRLEDDNEDEDEEFALGPASSLSSKLPTKSQETKVGNLLKI